MSIKLVAPTLPPITGEWTEDWPTEPGRYWFFGYIAKTCWYSKPELYATSVSLSANGKCVYINIDIMRKDNGAHGYFHSMVIPEVPKFPEVETK